MAAEHGQKVFAITTNVLAISSIFPNTAKMKEFKEDVGELFVLLSVLHLVQRRRKHAITIPTFLTERTRVLSISSIPYVFLLFCLFCYMRSE